MIALLVLHSHQKRGSCFWEPLLAYCLYLACPFFMRAKGKQGENTPGACFHRRARWKRGAAERALRANTVTLVFEPSWTCSLKKSRFKTRPHQKRGSRFWEPLFWCGRKDLNLHNLAIIRTWILRVCQFRHARVGYGSHRRLDNHSTGSPDLSRHRKNIFCVPKKILIFFDISVKI